MCVGELGGFAADAAVGSDVVVVVPECVEDDLEFGQGCCGVDGEAQHFSGVVIDPTDDLRIGAISQGDVGEVGLPELVRAVGGEASPG